MSRYSISARRRPRSSRIISPSLATPRARIWCFGHSCRKKLRVVRGREEEPVQGWAQDPDWRPVPTAIVGYKGVGKVRLAYVLYPLPEGKASPIETVEQLPVFADDRPVEDAIGLCIRFRDGRTHTILCADGPGVRRRVGALETDASIEWTDRFQGRVQ